jgi:hypothetical protein
MENVENYSPTNMKLISQNLLGSIPVRVSQSDRLRKRPTKGARAMAASVLCPTALLYRVSYVVALRAETQMIGPNARRVITLMEDAKTLRDFPVINNPRGLVGADVSLVLYRAVAALTSRAAPLPALTLRPKSRRLINLGPKADCYRSVFARLRAESLLGSLKPPAPAKLLAACFAVRDSGCLLHLLFSRAGRGTKTPTAALDFITPGYEFFTTNFAGAWYFTASHDMNLQGQVCVWSGSLENHHSLAGRLYFNTRTDSSRQTASLY